LYVRSVTEVLNNLGKGKKKVPVRGTVSQKQLLRPKRCISVVIAVRGITSDVGGQAKVCPDTKSPWTVEKLIFRMNSDKKSCDKGENGGKGNV